MDRFLCVSRKLHQVKICTLKQKTLRYFHKLMAGRRLSLIRNDQLQRAADTTWLSEWTPAIQHKPRIDLILWPQIAAIMYNYKWVTGFARSRIYIIHVHLWTAITLARNNIFWQDKKQLSGDREGFNYFRRRGGQDDCQRPNNTWLN